MVEGDAALLPGQMHHYGQELNTFMEDYIDIRGYELRPLALWKEVGEARCHTLARVAYDLFAVPGMSAECEGDVSHAKKMVTEEHRSSRGDIIEAEQCLRSWLVSEIVDGAQTWTALQEPNNDQAMRGVVWVFWGSSTPSRTTCVASRRIWLLLLHKALIAA